MKITIATITITLLCVTAILAESSNSNIVVTLSAPDSHRSSLSIEVANKGTASFLFLDVFEGSYQCSEFYSIIVKTPAGKSESDTCLYAPLGTPHLVTIKAGETYRRKINPTSYCVPKINTMNGQRLTPPFEVAVKYRIKEYVNDPGRAARFHLRDGYASRYPGLDTTFEFVTNFVKVEK